MLPSVDWPRLRAAVAREAWQQAYSAAHNDPAAVAHIETAKAEALARLTEEWRARHAS